MNNTETIDLLTNHNKGSLIVTFGLSLMAILSVGFMLLKYVLMKRKKELLVLPPPNSCSMYEPSEVQKINSSGIEGILQFEYSLPIEDAGFEGGSVNTKNATV